MVKRKRWEGVGERPDTQQCCVMAEEEGSSPGVVRRKRLEGFHKADMEYAAWTTLVESRSCDDSPAKHWMAAVADSIDPCWLDKAYTCFGERSGKEAAGSQTGLEDDELHMLEVAGIGSMSDDRLVPGFEVQTTRMVAVGGVVGRDDSVGQLEIDIVLEEGDSEV